MYNLRIADMEFNASGTKGVLILKESKSGTRYNIVESVTITDRGGHLFGEGHNGWKRSWIFDFSGWSLSLSTML